MLLRFVCPTRSFFQYAVRRRVPFVRCGCLVHVSRFFRVVYSRSRHGVLLFSGLLCHFGGFFSSVQVGRHHQLVRRSTLQLRHSCSYSHRPLLLTSKRFV